MKSVIYSDYDNPVVIEKAKELTQNAETIEEKLNALFLYVRDGILFGFNKEGDFIKASEIIKKGIGQCNNKAVLFLALVRALDFKARIHFSTIDIEIQYGIFPWWALAIFPKYISHSWVEVYYKGRWVNIDAFINDEYFYNAGKSLLRKQKRKLGYSIACSKGESGIDLSWKIMDVIINRDLHQFFCIAADLYLLFNQFNIVDLFVENGPEVPVILQCIIDLIIHKISTSEIEESLKGGSSLLEIVFPVFWIDVL